MEVIVTLIIIGAMAAMALPNYRVVLEKTRAAEGVQLLDAILKAQIMHNYEEGSYANDLNDLDVEITFPTRYFSAGSTDGTDPAVATLVRAPGAAIADYSLEIDLDGSVFCTGAGASELCSKMGFTYR